VELDARLDPLREYCLDRRGATEEFPFGPDAMVLKVVGKMFGLIAWEANPLSISLKCDPERAVELREQHPAIVPGYHLNKKHWNTITLDGGISLELVHELVDHSYDLVCSGLSRKERSQLED